MPRIVFTEQLDLSAWLDQFGDPMRYTAYQTSKNELILEPKRSTQPLRYAYLKCPTFESLNRVTEELKRKNYVVLRCREYHFASDREVWAKNSLEETEE